MIKEIKARENKSRRMVVLWIFSFFGIIILMNVYMVYQASTTFNGLVAEKSYQQGINYNNTLDLEKKILSEGLDEDLDLIKDGLKLTVKLALSHRNNSYKFPEYVDFMFTRPTNNKQDFQLKLAKQKDATNTYSQALIFRADQKGVWNIEYKLYTLDGKAVKFYDRVVIK